MRPQLPWWQQKMNSYGIVRASLFHNAVSGLFWKIIFFSFIYIFPVFFHPPFFFILSPIFHCLYYGFQFIIFMWLLSVWMSVFESVSISCAFYWVLFLLFHHTPDLLSVPPLFLANYSFLCLLLQASGRHLLDRNLYSKSSSSLWRTTFLRLNQIEQ